MKIVFFDGALEQGKRLLVARGVLESDIHPIGLEYGVSAMRAEVSHLTLSLFSNVHYLVNSFDALDSLNKAFDKNFDAESMVSVSFLLRANGELFGLERLARKLATDGVNFMRGLFHNQDD